MPPLREARDDIGAEAPALQIQGITHAYFGRTVLDGIDLSVASGEVVALVGPSGCGKSTLAHIAAGVTTPTRGAVARHYRRHGMVFQELRLLPWATAESNIAYPLRVRGTPSREIRDRVRVAALQAALSPDDLAKYPAELSGGMKQRTAIARAIVGGPDFVYFDEPFTALDTVLRRRMQNLVIAATGALNFGALFITHDLMEAFRVANRVALMDARGNGIAGERDIPGIPGERLEGDLFSLVDAWLHGDTLFRHVNEVDERQIA